MWLIAFVAVQATCGTTLSTVAEVLAYAESREHACAPFEFSGIALSDAAYGLIFQDNTGRTILHNIDPQSPIRRGDRVTATGTFQIGNFRQLLFETDSITVTGHETPPAAIPINGCDIARRDLFNTLVKVTGVLSDVSADAQDRRFNWADLRTDTGLVRVSIYRQLASADELKRFIDTEVSIEGFPIPPSNWRRHLANTLTVRTRNAITLLSPPASDPMSAPLFTAKEDLHRQRIEGTVIVRSMDEFYVSTDIQSCLRVCPSDSSQMPEPGATVIVSGFFEPDPLNLQVVGACIKVKPGSHPLPKPEDVCASSLFVRANNIDRNDPVFNGCLLRISGIVLETPAKGGHSATIISDGHNLTVDLSALSPQERRKFETGNKVKLVALCLPQFDTVKSKPEFLKIDRFTLIPRMPSEITVIERPGWWTSGRLLVVIGTLLTLILVTMTWNVLLHKVSERRGRELAAAAITKAEADFKIYERTRLAVELHDSVAQMLTGVSMELCAAARAVRDDPSRLNSHLVMATKSLESCREELRNCLWDLRNLTLDESTVDEAIQKAVSQHLGDASLSVRFNVPRDRFSDNTLHAILRIIRELVINAVRHGNATEIRIAGSLGGEKLLFSVRDNGCGFNPNSAPSIEQGHFGLQGIRDRVDLLNGEVVMRSAPGKGTKATISIPIHLNEKGVAS